MPKPLLLRRPSGWFVRLLLPADVRGGTGRRWLVRSLGALRGDEARLAAARMGYAVAQAVSTLRQGGAGMDPKKQRDLLNQALAAAGKGETREYDLNIPGVIHLRADGPEDHRRALESIGLLRDVLPDQWARSRAPAGPMLHESIDRFLTHFKGRGSGVAPATVEQTEHTLGLFRELVDDRPLAEVTGDHIEAFREAMAHWPPHARVRKVYQGLSAREILARARQAGSGATLSTRTMEKHLDRLRVFFNHAIKTQKITLNPVAGLRLQTPQVKYTPTRRGFRPDELRILFDPVRRARWADDPLYYWIPTLALLTGGRLNELAQLTIHDLERVADYWGIHITNEDGKRLKNAQSRRFVPLPDRVLELGFLDYAQAIRARGFTALFPGGSTRSKNGVGNRVGKWFNRTYLHSACGLTDGTISFHSFRHTLSTVADRVGITETQMGRITGHAARSIQSRHYIDPPTIPERKAHLDRMAAYYDLPTLTPYQPGQFDAYWDDLPNRERREERRREKRRGARMD